MQGQIRRNLESLEVSDFQRSQIRIIASNSRDLEVSLQSICLESSPTQSETAQRTYGPMLGSNPPTLECLKTYP
jgi:hypothetical protein